jgi:transcriptional regulator with XRE-family HTH domain
MSASDNGTKFAILPAHARAGRALLGWSQDQLVAASNVPKRTLVRFELGDGTPQRRTLTAIRAALEAAGVEFTNGDAPGVRLKTGNERG